jgi:hypothetical protein
MLSAIQLLLEGNHILSESMLSSLARHPQPSVNGPTGSASEMHTISSIEHNEVGSHEISNEFWETFDPPLNESRLTELGYDPQLFQRMKEADSTRSR